MRVIIGILLSPPPHWAPEHREVALKSQIWKILKWVQTYHVWWIKASMIAVYLFEIFVFRIWEILDWKFERFAKNALTQLENCLFLNESEFRRNWLVPLSVCYSGTYVISPASKKDKDPYELSVTSEPSVPPPLPPVSYEIIFWHTPPPPPSESYYIILERPLTGCGVCGVSVGCFHSVSRGSLMSQWCVSLFEWRIKGVLTLVKRTFMGV